MKPRGAGPPPRRAKPAPGRIQKLPGSLRMHCNYNRGGVFPHGFPCRQGRDALWQSLETPEAVAMPWRRKFVWRHTH